MNKILFAGAAALVLTAQAAPAVAAPVSGGRVEAVIGWDKLSLGLDDVGVDEDFDESGAVFGVGIGYDLPVGPGSAMGVDLEATLSSAGANIADGTDSADVNFGRDLYAGLRFTTAVSDNLNLYLGAGYTNQRVSLTVTNGFDISSDSATADGVRARAGLQIGLGRSAYANVEYRYSNYEEDLSRHQAIGGIGIRF
jgi:outer membrane immunogenic protein